MLQTFQTHGSAKLALLVVILGRKIGKECQNPSLPLYEILTAIVQIITSWFVYGATCGVCSAIYTGLLSLREFA
jgi:hypothetical protein